MDEDEANELVINTTADLMELAHEVCMERQRQDENEFAPSEEPSVMEVVAVANLIVNMTVAGMFKVKKPDDWVPSAAAFDAFIERIQPIIDAKVSLALSKERLREAQSWPRPVLPPVPPPFMPPDDGEPEKAP